MNFVCIVFELGDKMLTLSSMENLIVQCNHQSEWILGTLCAHLLLQFYIDSFETSQVFWTWSEDMHVVWI